MTYSDFKLMKHIENLAAEKDYVCLKALKDNFSVYDKDGELSKEALEAMEEFERRHQNDI